MRVYVYVCTCRLVRWSMSIMSMELLRGLPHWSSCKLIFKDCIWYMWPRDYAALPSYIPPTYAGWTVCANSAMPLCGPAAQQDACFLCCCEAPERWDED